MSARAEALEDGAAVGVRLGDDELGLGRLGVLLGVGGGLCWCGGGVLCVGGCVRASDV